MKSSKIWITDYVKNPHIEREILGEQLAENPDDGVEVLLFWHQQIDT